MIIMHSLLRKKILIILFGGLSIVFSFVCIKYISSTNLLTKVKVKNINNEYLIVENSSIIPVYFEDNKINSKSKMSLSIEKLAKNDKINLHLKLFGKIKYKSYVINIYPPDFPKMKTYGHSNYKGYIHTTAQCSDYENTHCYYLLKFNAKGEIVFYRKINEQALRFSKVKNKKSETRYTYITSDSGYEAVDDYKGRFIILDKNYREIDRVSYILNKKDCGIDTHDALYVDDGDYILATAVKKTNNSSYYKQVKYLHAIVIQEQINGKIKWKFDSSEYDMLLKYYKPELLNIKADDSLDYLHFNSFVVDPKDNNLLVSFRNINAVIKINRNTGKLMWILGGKGDQFGLSEGQKFLHQHSVSVEKDGTILLYDNGEKDLRDSRVAEIKIDEGKKKITSYNVFFLDGVFTSSYGYVQELNKKKGIYLLNYGLGGNPDKPDIEEVNLKTGKVYFSINFPNQPVYHVYKG